VVVVGGGPAGCAAALAAQRAKLSVALIEQHAETQRGACPGWVGPAAVAACAEWGITAANVGAVQFTGVRLWSWNLAQRAEVQDAELTGWLVAAPALTRAFQAAVRSRPACVVVSARVADVELRETCVELKLSDGSRRIGRILLIADGAGSDLARLAHVPLAAAGATAGTAAQLAWEASGGTSGLDIVIGTERGMKLATVVRTANRVCVTLSVQDSTAPALALMPAWLQAASARGLIPPPPAVAPVAIPAALGHALEVESHAGKRCVVVGDAGGFVTAFSNEGTYPALRSGVLAAEIAGRALAAPVLQDELATFSSAWRAELADYMRLPNTDLGLLLPMVFGNQPMSRRLARAFVLGQGF
jgi:flavin-dependent dehydrogenase